MEPATVLDAASWQPRVVAAEAPDTPDVLRALAAGGGIGSVHDGIGGQLAELCEIRHPDEDPTPAQIASLVEAHLAGRDPERYGSWIHYPWSGRLVHLLPEDEFRELRTNRNRNKITEDEQARLSSLRIGVVGLSVGRATAVTLALEGVGGELRLADFDRVSLSNLNRLAAGVHEIGFSKAVLAARQVAEIDPYLRIALFPEGITDENLDRFLAGPAPLDLVFEECDDLFAKIRVRERAKALRIPVLMETNDRGLLDVERFDREPERPLFHGRCGALDAETVRGLSTKEKVPIVLRILGEDLSPRAAASLVEVRSSLRSWPQLASGVALGAALNVEAARRIALGGFTASGRFRVDLEEMLADGHALPGGPAPADRPPVPETVAERTAPANATIRGRRPDLATSRALVELAVLAPSGGNCQPWRFEIGPRSLQCFVDPKRTAFDERASFLALGAAIENIALAAGAAGIGCEIAAMPDARRPTLAGEVIWSGGVAPGRDEALFAQVSRRVTNRRTGARERLDPRDAALLEARAREGDADLALRTETDALDEIGKILGAGDRLRLLSRAMHGETMAELRWTPEEVLGTRDGLDVSTLELSRTDLAGLRLVSSWRVARILRDLGGGRSLETLSRRAIDGASAVGLVTVAGSTPSDFVRAGRAVQRLWLEAMSLGWALQPVTAITYLFTRTEPPGADLDDHLHAELAALRARYLKVFPVRPGHAEPFLFRLTRAEAPTARSLRRPVDLVLRVPAA